MFQKRCFDIPGKMEKLSDTFTLNISMLSVKTIEHLIMGMFEPGKMGIYDDTSKAEFLLKYDELMPELEFKETMIYKVQTPAVFSKKVIYNGKESPHYFSPDEKEFGLYFLKNVSEKFKIFSGQKDDILNSDCDVKIISDSKKNIWNIGSNTGSSQRVVGYKYDFELTAPADLQRMVWMTRIGAKNSMGFGFVDVKKS